MMVSWTTMGSAAAASSVRFGASAAALNRTASGSSVVFDDGGAVQSMRLVAPRSWSAQTRTFTCERTSHTRTDRAHTHPFSPAPSMHTATLRDLAPATRYYYALADDAVVRSFVNEPTPRVGGKVYAVFADLGLANDVALATLVSEAAAGAFDAVVREYASRGASRARHIAPCRRARRGTHRSSPRLPTRSPQTPATLRTTLRTSRGPRATIT